jgi:hypothetical protein
VAYLIQSEKVVERIVAKEQHRFTKLLNVIRVVRCSCGRRCSRSGRCRGGGGGRGGRGIATILLPRNVEKLLQKVVDKGIELRVQAREIEQNKQSIK